MRRLQLLFALFVIIPLVEIWLLIKVGGLIGAWPTVGVVVLTAIAGTALLRAQGLSTVQRIQVSLARGELPARELIEGALLLLAGALLLTPGFVTDAWGFLCLIPPLRGRLAAWLLRRLGRGMAGQGVAGSRTLEGEWRRDND